MTEGDEVNDTDARYQDIQNVDTGVPAIEAGREMLDRLNVDWKAIATQRAREADQAREALSVLIDAVVDDFSPHYSRGRRTVDAITAARRVLDV